MEFFAKIFNDWKMLIVLANSTIFYIWPGCEYASAISSLTKRDSSSFNVDDIDSVDDIM